MLDIQKLNLVFGYFNLPFFMSYFDHLFFSFWTITNYEIMECFCECLKVNIFPYI